MLLVLAPIGLSACGETHRDAPSPPGDEDRDGGKRPGYFDGDDNSVRYFGRAANPGEASAITTLVKRYYSAAAAMNSSAACALTYYISVETIPEEYGQPPGPLYLRGAHTCQAVLAIVFKHFHAELTQPVMVMGVRVDGNHADALVGFRALPAGFVQARLEGNTWKVEGLLATALP